MSESKKFIVINGKKLKTFSTAKEAIVFALYVFSNNATANYVVSIYDSEKDNGSGECEPVCDFKSEEVPPSKDKVVYGIREILLSSHKELKESVHLALSNDYFVKYKYFAPLLAEGINRESVTRLISL